tara:strand:- start:243 stop:746 length:504 start_codon:yes stop_codon:yes gene_type:complete
MSILKPIKIRGRRVVLTKKMIEEAQQHTKSNMSAAKWLGISYNTYKKWAKYYSVFEQHLNPKGFGVKKGWATYKISIDDIVTGKRKPPKRYSLSVLKKRFIEEGYLQDECSKCGYNEVNLIFEKVCLNLDFEDGDNKNFDIRNLRLLCPNCYLSMNGFFNKSKLFCK